MIRFTVRFAVAVLLANAAYRIGSEYFAHLRFRDGVRDTAASTANTDDELRRRIMALAGQHDVPLTHEQLAIRETGHQVFVQGSYRKPIALLPLYAYPWRFELSIEVARPPASPETRRAR